MPCATASTRSSGVPTPIKYRGFAAGSSGAIHHYPPHDVLFFANAQSTDRVTIKTYFPLCASGFRDVSQDRRLLVRCQTKPARRLSLQLPLFARYPNLAPANCQISFASVWPSERLTPCSVDKPGRARLQPHIHQTPSQFPNPMPSAPPSRSQGTKTGDCRQRANEIERPPR